MDEESFSGWLSARMAELSVSQNELARRTGVGQTAIKGWVTGFTKPSWHNCREIAHALSSDPGYVRRLAGYVDPGDEANGPGDPDLMECQSIYLELSPENRDALLRVVRGLRDFQRRTVEASKKGQ
jgi:transcriptional regulator with XRE-family HTH domain